jgi:DNA-3-methyladenine glycosylase II
MRILIPTVKPFDFVQSLTFIERFPACRCDTLIERGALTAALAIDGTAYGFTLRAADDDLVIETDAPAKHRAALVRRAGGFVGAGDDLAPFYAAARGDRPFARVVAALHGLHHVRFLAGLDEIAVYAVMMQRTPPAMAARLKQRFLAQFGHVTTFGNHELRAMPAIAEVARLDVDDVAEAIGHRAKAERIVTVARGVARLGEDFLRTAPFDDARAALVAIRGVGPFSASAILLRGIGRMDALATLAWFEDDARLVYGNAWDAKATLRRYGAHVGYWSFYVKTAAARYADGLAPSLSTATPIAAYPLST